MKTPGALTFCLLLVGSCANQSPTTPAGGEDMAQAADADACALSPPPNPEFLCQPTGAGACQSCNDCRQIEDGSAKTASAQCGAACIGATSPSCTRDCLHRKTTLSDGCITCLDMYFQCLLQNCLAECSGGTPAQCTTCSRNKPSAGAGSCSGALEQCSGATANPSYQP